MNYDLVGIGNALVDVEVQVDDSFIAEHSLTKGGMQLSSPEEQSRLLDLLKEHDKKNSSGGSAANTIHGAGALGAKTYYLGRVANDAFGRLYTEDMARCGVGFPGPDAEQSGTGTCLVLITPDAERTMLTHLGVSSTLHPDNVDSTIVRNAKGVYIEGYLWTGDETREAALQLSRVAKKENAFVSFSLSDAFIVNAFKDSVTEFIRGEVDILFCNDVEARAMAATENLDEAFARLLELADTVFMTRGKDGSWVGKAGEERLEVNTFPVEAVDATGAGDLYAAGALHGMINGHSLKECGVLGSYCAAQVVTHLGARMPVGSHTEAEDILKKYPS